MMPGGKYPETDREMVHDLFELALGTEHASRAFAHGGAHLTKRARPAAALEYLDSELILGERDLRRQRRLGDMALLGGAAKRAEIRDRHDVLQLSERHGRGDHRLTHSQRLSNL